MAIKPDLENDNSNAPDDATVGTFQGVKNACMGYEGRRYYFEQAFDAFETDFVAIHFDTAEIDRQDFTFLRPPKDDLATYCTNLRQMVIELINSWLEGSYENKILYAVAIEEMEAWLLTLHLKTETASSADAKKKWREQILPKLKDKDNSKITKDFSKKKELKKYLPHNQSLRKFIESLEQTFQQP